MNRIIRRSLGHRRIQRMKLMRDKTYVPWKSAEVVEDIEETLKTPYQQITPTNPVKRISESNPVMYTFHFSLNPESSCLTYSFFRPITHTKTLANSIPYPMRILNIISSWPEFLNLSIIWWTYSMRTLSWLGNLLLRLSNTWKKPAMINYL